MELNEEQIKRFFDTLVKIIGDRENVKIEYTLVDRKGDDSNE